MTDGSWDGFSFSVVLIVAAELIAGLCFGKTEG